MNKISMDALNSGWALGFGTPITKSAIDESLLSYGSGSRVSGSRHGGTRLILPTMPGMIVSTITALSLLFRLARDTARRLHLASQGHLKLAQSTGATS